MKHLTLVLFCFVGASGCALRYTDAHGRVQTVGLVWTTHQPAVVTPADDVDAPATRLLIGRHEDAVPPCWVEMHAIGLVVEKTDQQVGATVGYKDSIWVFPAEDAITDVESFGRKEPPRIVVRRPTPAASEPAGTPPLPRVVAEAAQIRVMAPQ